MRPSAAREFLRVFARLDGTVTLREDGQLFIEAPRFVLDAVRHRLAAIDRAELESMVREGMPGTFIERAA